MFGAAGTLIAGRRVERSGRYRIWPLAGSVLMLVGVALLSTLGATTPAALVGAFALLFRSLGNTIGIPIFGGILNAGLVGGPRDAAAFADILPLVFLAAVPVAIASVVIASRLKDRPLRDEVALALSAAPATVDR